MIRFLFDEHVPHAIARGLSLRGVEALALVDVGMLTEENCHSEGALVPTRREGISVEP